MNIDWTGIVTAATVSLTLGTIAKKWFESKYLSSISCKFVSIKTFEELKGVVEQLKQDTGQHSTRIAVMETKLDSMMKTMENVDRKLDSLIESQLKSR